MAKFVQIGSEIMNLDQVARVERGNFAEHQDTVVVYFAGDPERTQSRYTGPQAHAVWQRFAGIAEQWEAPGDSRQGPITPGRVADQS